MTEIKPRSKTGRTARTKGHSYERQMAALFRTMGFPEARRQLEYHARDARGIDLQDTGNYRVQIKKRKNYAPINTLEEIQLDSPEQIPVLITAGDRQQPVACIPLWAFERLVRYRHTGNELPQLPNDPPAQTT